jgi:hypothetical protein
MTQHAFFLFVTLLLAACDSNSKPKNIENKSVRIDSVYDMIGENPNGKWNTIFFDTKKCRRNELVKDTNSVLTLLDKTPDWQWVLISVMPANADEARGTNEHPEIYYVPLKAKIDCKSIMNKAGCTWIAFIQKDQMPAVIVSCGVNVDTLLLKSFEKNIVK